MLLDRSGAHRGRRLAGAGCSPRPVEFNTNPAPGQAKLTNEVGDYTVELKSLDPYPKTPDDSPALTDYSATLLVRQTA